MNRKFKEIAIISDLNNDFAVLQKQNLIAKYNFIDFDSIDESQISQIDLLVALGGDGKMLHLLHKIDNFDIPIYGINCGTVGFLMNSFNKDADLISLINNAKQATLHPLQMTAVDQNDAIHKHFAINEVSLLRQLSLAAKIRVSINGKTRIESLICDGILASTPAGSTAYNLSLHGSIIPLGSQMLAMTPISPFRPRNWSGALLPSNSVIEFEVLENMQRPVSATADFIEVRNVKKVSIVEDQSISFKILFDPDHSLDEKIIREQFAGY